MIRILLVLATVVPLLIGYAAPADACGVKLTAKAPRVDKKVKPSDNPSRILLVGNPPRRLVSTLSQAGHTVDVAESPAEADKKNRYALVVADQDRVEETESAFPNSWVVPRSGSTRSNMQTVEDTLAKGPTKPRRDRTMVARRARDSQNRQARETQPQPRRPSPGPTEIARSNTTEDESPSGVASISRTTAPQADEQAMVTVPSRAEEPKERVRDERARNERPARVEAREHTFTEELFFGSNSVRLNNRGRAQLAENARWLKQNPEVSITIEGHTDAPGSNEYNMMMGERRAKMVRDYLVSRGVSRSRIEVISYGEDRPAYPEDDSRNRRVLIVKN